MKFINNILNILIFSSLFAHTIPSFGSNNVDTHLSKFSEFNSNYHDNIDDEVHEHKHKHSEDGEEHEHSHEHTKISQNEIKFLIRSYSINSGFVVVKVENCFHPKIHNSTPHPFGIFRPPIA